MNISCIMMQKNERLLIEAWIAYHGDLFGFENLYVYDNGSTDDVVIKALDRARSIGVNVVNQFNKKSDFNKKGEIIAAKIKELDKSGFYNFHFPLDCDEFISVQDGSGKIYTSKEKIIGELSKYVSSKDTLTISSMYFNNPVKDDEYMVNANPRKCFFPKDSCESLDIGFHQGKSSSGAEERTNISYFHFHNKPYENFVESAKRKMEGRISIINSDVAKKYVENRGAGAHLVERLMLTEDEYYSRFKLNENKPFQVHSVVVYPEFRAKLEHLGAGLNWKPAHALRAQALEAPQRQPRAHIDAIYIADSQLIVEGWAFDSFGRGAMHVALLSDGVPVQTFRYQTSNREDVQRQMGTAADCGFQIRVELRNIPPQWGKLKIVAFDLFRSASFQILEKNVDEKLSALESAAKEVRIYQDPAQLVRDAPSMPTACADFLESSLKAAQCYLEYGSGGSTLLAARVGVPTVLTVESDKSWMELVKIAVEECGGKGDQRFFWQDIGKTKEWGFPAGESKWKNFYRYAFDVWKYVKSDGTYPDLVLVDGRFRLACAIATIMNAKPGTVVLFDDYFDREYYRVLEEHASVAGQIERMAKFVVPDYAPKDSIIDHLLSAVQDPR